MSDNGGSPMSGREEEPNGAPVERERSVSRDRSRERSRERSKKEKHSRRDRDGSRERKSRRDRSRSRSRDRKRRSRSRDRHRRRRSRSRERRASRQRSRSRSRGRGGRSRSRSRDSAGGYKPRKRQEPAKPAASMFATNDPYAHLRSKVSSDPAEAMRLWQEQMLKSRQLVLAQQAKSAVQQANKAQRELYIGNLTAGAVTEAMLGQVFDSALIAAFPQAAAPGQEPVCKVNIHSDGRYGFVEFRSPEYASAALQLNGQINLMGQALSIGRPASYVDPNKVHQAAAQAEAALAAFQSGAGIPLPSIAAAEALLPGTAGAHMAAAGNAAAAGHNEAAVAAGTVPAEALAAAAGPFPGPPGGAAAGAGVGPAPAGAALVTEAGASSIPTPYVVVAGMITPEVLEDGEEYEEVLLDLKEECGRHGAVYEVKVPRPANPQAARHLFGTGNYGKAYVQFVDTAGAQKARDAIHGRMFAGNPVSAVYLTAQAYGVAMAAMEQEAQLQQQ
uniref:RRM domain-containing protein n=1 Tax=Tetradesmus obliquus TaxID=3088 RepID=A0A383WCK0_TETOB